MRKSKLLLKAVFLSVPLALLLAQPSHALMLTEVSGSFFGTVGGGGTVNYLPDNPVRYGNGVESQVRWGNPPERGTGQSGLGFTGAAASSFEIGEVFQIGQLRHFNFPILDDGGNALSTGLEVRLSFSEPMELSRTFNFTFGVDETPNNAWFPLISDNDDFIFFPSSCAAETLDIAGTLFTLQLLGFGRDAQHLDEQFRSSEMATNETLLWGRITTASPVPEPATILLFGFGLIGLSGFSKGVRRFLRKNELPA